MANIFLTAAIIFTLLGVCSSMGIVSYLSDRGVKINWFLLRYLLPRYVSLYKKITIDEEGKPGVWYYRFVVSMLSALVLAILGLVAKSF